MIKTLTIHNFQSHNDTVLNFHEGVNVITGSSRSGKSAVFRSLLWNRYNRPIGNSFNSYWNREGKKILERIETSIVFSDGEASRVKKDDFNGYLIGDKKFEAVDKDVPTEVEQLYNMSEVNFQKQFNQPFLLSESPGEIAKFFNRLVNLDLIDESLSKAESKRRETNKELKNSSEKIVDYEKQIESYNWVSEVEGLIELAERREKRIEEKTFKRNDLEFAISRANNAFSEMEKIPNFSFQEKIIIEAENLDKKIDSKVTYYNAFFDLVSSIESLKEEINKDSIPDNIGQFFSEAEKTDQKLNSLEKNRDMLTNLISSTEKANEEIKLLEDTIINLEIQLPNICPMCGQQINNCKENT